MSLLKVTGIVNFADDFPRQNYEHRQVHVLFRVTDKKDQFIMSVKEVLSNGDCNSVKQKEVDFDNFIDLRIGEPLPENIPDLNKVFTKIEGLTSLLYSEENPTHSESLIELLCWNDERWEGNITSDNVLLTNGASHGLDLALSRFTEPGDIMFVLEPTYYLAGNFFKDHKLSVYSVKSIQELEEKVATIRVLQRLFLYIVPTNSNPMGTTLCNYDRQRLCRISNTHNIQIISDETYEFLTFDEEKEDDSNPWLHEHSSSAISGMEIVHRSDAIRFTACIPLHLLDDSVISLHTFSKIICPGLRLGWITSSTENIKALKQGGVYKSGGAFQPCLMEMLLNYIKSKEFRDHINYLRGVYAYNCEVLYGKLIGLCPSLIKITKPSGGYYLWVYADPKLGDLEKIFENHGIKIKKGVRSETNHYRICFARLRLEEWRTIDEIFNNIKTEIEYKASFT